MAETEAEHLTHLNEQASHIDKLEAICSTQEQRILELQTTLAAAKATEAERDQIAEEQARASQARQVALEAGFEAALAEIASAKLEEQHEKEKFESLQQRLDIAEAENETLRRRCADQQHALDNKLEVLQKKMRKCEEEVASQLAPPAPAVPVVARTRQGSPGPQAGDLAQRFSLENTGLNGHLVDVPTVHQQSGGRIRAATPSQRTQAVVWASRSAQVPSTSPLQTGTAQWAVEPMTGTTHGAAVCAGIRVSNYSQDSTSPSPLARRQTLPSAEGLLTRKAPMTTTTITGMPLSTITPSGSSVLSSSKSLPTPFYGAQGLNVEAAVASIMSSTTSSGASSPLASATMPMRPVDALRFRSHPQAQHDSIAAQVSQSPPAVCRRISREPSPRPA